MPTTNDIYLQRFDGVKWAEALGIITFSSTNDVGIGTSSPTAPLHVVNGGVNSASSILLIQHTNLSAGVSIGYDGIAASGSSTNLNLTIGAKGSGVIQLSSTLAYGNVRLGTNNIYSASGPLYLGYTNAANGINFLDGSHFLSTTGLGLGTVSPGAMLQVNTSSASAIGIIVKGAASQSANLQEWQNSSGTILAQIDSAGGVYFNKSTGNTSISTSGTDTIIKNNNAALIRLQSNSGHSFENSSGTSYFKSSSSGAAVLNTLLIISGDGSSSTGVKLEQAHATSYYYLTMRHANGGGSCGLKIFSANDMSNSSYLKTEINSTAFDIVSTSIGTGVTVPIRFLIDSTEVLRMDSAGLISFSGVAATDVALKQSGTQLQVRLGDDSAFGNLQAAEVIFGGGTIAATASTLGIFGVTPAAQPTTAITAATFVANTSAIADDTATWDGYTIGQIVAALRTLGVLA